ncbi:MAG: hypothetical protein LBH75_04660 [Treponema sp.]|jgi:hypothetical protein|nr:hypothetical protein [Treponema sp.]
MLISAAELQKYTGTLSNDTGLQELFCQSATDIIGEYLGYSPELAYRSEYHIGTGDAKLQLCSKPIYYLVNIRSKNKNIVFQKHDVHERYTIREEFVELADEIFERTNLEVEYISGYGEKRFGIHEICGGLSYSEINEIIDAGNAYTNGGGYYSGGDADAQSLEININAPMPLIFRQTALRIAALLQTESQNNIGVSGVSFGESGSRSFINYTNFDKYLSPLSRYRLLII